MTNNMIRIKQIMIEPKQDSPITFELDLRRKREEANPDNRRGAVKQVEGYAVYTTPDDRSKARSQSPGRSRQKAKQERQREESKGLSRSPERSSGRDGSRGRDRVSRKDTPAFPFDISVGSDLREARGFEEKEKSLNALEVFVVERPTASTRMHITGGPDESNRVAVMRGIPIYGPDVLRLNTQQETLQFLSDLYVREIKSFVYKPLKEVYFYMGDTIGQRLEQQLMDLLKQHGGGLAIASEADLILLNPAKQEPELDIEVSFQALYHMIGAGGILKHPTRSANLGHAYGYGKGAGNELIPIVKAKLEHFSGDLDPQLSFFARKVYLDKRSLNRSKDKELAKAVTQIVDLLPVVTVEDEDDADIIITTQLKLESNIKETQVVLHPAWLLDSLLVGRLLDIHQYWMGGRLNEKAKPLGPVWTHEKFSRLKTREEVKENTPTTATATSAVTVT